MKTVFQKGDNKVYKKQVSQSDIAAFHGQIVHEVCSTFALARDMEWSSRLFVLEMKEEHEEGIGTFVDIKHKAPAFPGEEIIFRAEIDSIEGNEILCNIEVTVGDRVIATGQTGQKILPKEKLNDYFQKLKNG